MKKIIWIIAIVLLICAFLIWIWRPEHDVDDQKIEKKLAEMKQTAEVQAMEKIFKKAISEEGWKDAAKVSKELAIYYEENKLYEQAIDYYEESGIYWTKAGQPSLEVANTIRAKQIRTELNLYIEQQLPINQVLDKFEPTSGTYLGIYLAGQKENGDPNIVKSIYGRNHAIYLTYTDWRSKYENTQSYFPLEFAERAKANGSAIQVAWEPSNGLDDVFDDAYVRQFAREAKEADIPIFLRFAGEMNEKSVAWHDNPEKYKEKFRLIYNIMKEEAPNIAMVWSPNYLPRDNIDAYYPGDDVVDWVGMSLYINPFSGGQQVLGSNPIDYLKPIYKKYNHKPIMISEGAVSHISYEQGREYNRWAADQISNMYGFMPKIYPQLKAITYFNLDKRTVSDTNQNNNYDLADSVLANQRYQKMIQHPYFLDHLSMNQSNNAVKSQYVAVEDFTEMNNVHNAFVYVKLPLGKQPDHVAIYQGNRLVAESRQQPWEMRIDFNKIDKTKKLTLIAFNQASEKIAIKDVQIRNSNKKVGLK